MSELLSVGMLGCLLSYCILTIYLTKKSSFSAKNIEACYNCNNV